MQNQNRYHMFGLFLFLFIAAFASLVDGQITNIKDTVQLINEGKLVQAEKQARISLKNPATRALAYEMLGMIRLRQGKYDESTQYLSRSLNINPHLLGARLTLGDAYMLQSNPSRAQFEFEAALKQHPGNFGARLGLARAETSLHHYQESLQTAGPIEPDLRKLPDGIFLLVTDYLALGRKQAVHNLVQSWLDLPDLPEETSVSFGSMLMEHQMNVDAVKVFESVKLKASGHPSFAVAFNLGENYRVLNKLEDAEENYEIALSLKPDCAACNQRVAEIAEQEGKTEKALAYLIKAKKLEPGNPAVLFEFGRVCLKRNLVDDALAALKQAVEIKPGEDRYVYVLASAHVAKEQYPQAIPLLEQLVKKHPDDPVLNYSLGAVFYLQGNYYKAIGRLKKSISERPGQVASYYYLGLTYQRTGNQVQAEEEFRRVIRQDPKHAASYAALGALFLKQKKYDEARKYLERAITLNPGSVNAHYQLGLLFGRTGKTAESKEQLAIMRKLQAAERKTNGMQLHIIMPE